MSAAFAATSLGVTFKTLKPLIRYDLFTDPWTTRFDLNAPFGIDDMIYATDCKILISHPGRDDRGTEDRRVPKVGNLPWNEFDSSGWKPLGSPDLVVRTDHYRDNGHCCSVCFGLGRVGSNVVRCPDCHGRSEWVDEDANEVFDGCEKCRVGYVGGPICTHCERGWVNGPTIEERIIGSPRRFGTGMMARIRTLGDLEYRVVEGEGANDETSLLLFRGDHGIRGIACSMAAQ